MKTTDYWAKIFCVKTTDYWAKIFCVKTTEVRAQSFYVLDVTCPLRMCVPPKYTHDTSSLDSSDSAVKQ